MRILFVSARPPRPARRGDQARLSGWLRMLGGRHRVSVLALRPPGFPASSFASLADGRLIGHGAWQVYRGLVRGVGQPHQVAMHRSRPLAKALDRAIADDRPDVVVVMLSRMAWVLDHLDAVQGPDAPPVVVDLVDSLALNLRRRAAHEKRWTALLRREAARMDRWDAAVVDRAAAATVVAPADRDSIAGGDARRAARIEVVPFGLDVPDALPADPGTPARPVVLLSGNLGYFPTVDAASSFARDVWPRIRRVRPDAEWWLAGARPARAIRRFATGRAAQTKGIRLIADPPDLGAIRRQATVSIAPLRAGSGTPIKVLEAMADGIPVVITSLGRDGLEAIDDAGLTIADSADAHVEAILGLLADPAARRAQAEAAFGWLRERHDLESVARQFESILQKAADAH